MSKTESDICDSKLSIDECELSILRQASDLAEDTHGRELVQTDDVKKMVSILETFLRKEKLVCYGGTAINNVLPKDAQFYNYETEIPDYDFYTPTAMDHAKKLADIYAKAGFKNVEAKSGVHHGTYKVFVNFIPIADLTLLHPELFQAISKDCIVVNGIRYPPADFLRMNMYLELSRPAGHTARWEKVFKRLGLLNKHHPMKQRDCKNVEFSRSTKDFKGDSEVLFATVRDIMIHNRVIFFGSYASHLYSKHMSKSAQSKLKDVADFDVISENPEKVSDIIMTRLKELKYSNVKVVKHTGIEEIVPDCLEIRVGNKALALIYEPIACHNYNVVKVDGNDVRVATLDTMLNLYLAFYFSKKMLRNQSRILCMAGMLFDLQMKNRAKSKGILKRFSISCEGEQSTMQSIFTAKKEKYKELKDSGKTNSREFQEWFLNYSYEDGMFTGRDIEEKPKKKSKSVKRGKPNRRLTKKHYKK